MREVEEGRGEVWSWGLTSTNHAPQNSAHPQQRSHLLGQEIETVKRSGLQR